jgi:UDP-2,4-diacetamido-2,4,6-trideoxy-beta-L-altropyranose hydrolase
MIGIRADANSIVASGHMMRCMTIAKELTALSREVVFFVADYESKALFDAFMKDADDVEVVVLGSNWQDMEGEIPRLTEEMEKRNVDTLLVDSYRVTKEYFSLLPENCRIAYMDDLGKEPYPVDLLINYSGYYEEIGYDRLYSGVTSRSGRPVEFLLGLKYAPLRQQFQRVLEEMASEKTRDNKEDALSILLTAGGADMRAMLLSTLRAAKEAGLIGEGTLQNKTIWHVVVGSMVQNADEIGAFAEQYENVLIHRNVTDMADLMKECDVAVAAAGTMLTECAALRLPVIFYQVADNQKFNVAFWQKTGGMRFAGDVSCDDTGVRDETIREILRDLAELTEFREALAEMRQSLEGLTDAKGAARIAKALAF